MKKSNQKILTIFYLFAMVLASCTYSNYIPITVNEPMLKEAGEKQGIAYIGSNHVEIQGACALTKHFGVTGDIWKGFDKRYSFELMPGYYYSQPNGFCAGFYAGGGIANTSGEEYIYSTFPPPREIHEHWINTARYTSLMVQPGVGYRLKNFEIGVASRVSYITYSRYEASYSYWYSNETNIPVHTDYYHNDHLTTWVFQPAFNISAGLEHIKAFLSISGNIPVSEARMFHGRNHPIMPFYSFSSGLKIDLMRPKKFGKKQHLEF